MNFQILLGPLIKFNFLFFFLLSPLLRRHVFFKPPFQSLFYCCPYSLINDSLLELKKLKRDQLYVVNQQ
jgi:hypothetical protein